MQILWLKSFQKEIIENVFETAIFAELVKNFSKDSVFYWRTTDKKEIDFILKKKGKILPIEVKLNFEQFRSASIKYFNEKYKNNDYRVISLYGEVKDKFSIYPWQIRSEQGENR